jgi:hypothetical protein
VTAAARADKETGTVRILPNIRLRAEGAADAKAFNKKQKALLKRPVLVSLLQGGKVVRQKEFAVEADSLGLDGWSDVPTGSYDVRFQGEGIQTVLKKGLRVTRGETLRILGDLVAGKGARVIDYGKEGDPVDLLARIKKLEAAVEQLKKRK